MANSSIIGEAKNKIIKEFIKDDDIVAAIGSHEVTSREKLVGTHIFDFNQNPNTLKDVETFITVQVHIPQSFGFRSNVYVNPTVEIWIVSHEKHMEVTNVPKVTENRNDYLSKLIDRKLNGRRDFGVGELVLLSNTEHSYQKDYVYRTLVFEGKDLNKALCDRED